MSNPVYISIHNLIFFLSRAIGAGTTAHHYFRLSLYGPLT